ncbi:replication-relaxation family protein [Sediminibacillus massiliensis]|uniref:replication-relaxation family protein n=1 Tax=Sediminibacillus massiliensis TaxID=1926277 RepID=UPI0015C2D3D4|nr:replication-relaxation family protein [Sediminibacillus massiliensis]
MSLSRLGMLNRRQIQHLHDTGSVRNTNYLMQDLKPYTDYLERSNGRIYKLNQKGINLLGEGTLLKWGNVEHRIIRNDVYIKYRPDKWFPETEIKVKGVKVLPDAVFQSGMTYKILEVDRTQRWYKNKKKMEDYAKLKETGAFQKQYGHFPTIIWVVDMESRIPKIKQLGKELGLLCEVYGVKM